MKILNLCQRTQAKLLKPASTVKKSNEAQEHEEYLKKRYNLLKAQNAKEIKKESLARLQAENEALQKLLASEKQKREND